MQKQWRNSQENNSITVGQGPDSSSRNIYTQTYICVYTYIYVYIYILYISLSSSVGTNAPMQVKDGNFRLKTPRALTSYLITNQSEVTYPVDLILNFVYKNFSPQISREFWFFNISHPLSLLGSAIKLSLLQTLTFRFVLPLLTCAQ